MDLLDAVEQKYGKVDAIVSGFTLTVVWASKNVYDMLGYDEGELTGKSIREFIKLDAKKISLLVVEALRGKEEDVQEIITKNGDTIKVKSKGASFTFENEPYVIIVKAERNDDKN